MKTLLLGMGNPILSDDAVGVRLAADFKARLQDVPGLTVREECHVFGLSLLEVLSGYDRIVVLDSIKTQGGTPGHWYNFTAEALQETVHLTNIHDVNFATALELGRLVGIPLPRAADIHIFAVEVEDNLTFSGQMTATIEMTYPVYAAEILRELHTLLSLPPQSAPYPV